MREVNRSLILGMIKAEGPTSRANLAREARLAKPTVSAIVDELLAEGLVREVGPGATAVVGGRPPIMLEFNARSQLVCGIHIGARWTSMAIADATGVEVVRRRVATPGISAQAVVATVVAELRDAMAEGDLRGGTFAAVGVVLPGLTDYHTGVCLLAPNLGWRDVPIAAMCSAALRSEGLLYQRPDGQPGPERVYVHNAGQAAAVAENLEGSGGRVHDLALLYAGTGLSAGVLAEGRVLHGAGGTAGEIGHCAVPGLDHRCGCGKRGCFETVASGPALVRTVVRAVRSGRASTLLPAGLGPVEDTAGTDELDALAAATGLDARAIADAATDGDEVAAEAVAQLGWYLGLAASWLINAYNPEVVILGGGLAAIGEPVLAPMRAAVEEHALAPARSGVQVRASALGADAELRGALLLALQQSETYYRVVFRA